MKLNLTAVRWIILCLLVSFAPSCLFGQKTEADIRARLLKKPLFLRGQWSTDKVAFDAVGHLQGISGPTSFTLAGVDIASVKLTSKGLVLGGQRVGLEFLKDVPKRVALLVGDESGITSSEHITIKIQPPADGDFTTALDAIFTDNIASLDIPLQFCWQQYVQEHLLPGGAPSAKGSIPPVAGTAADAPSAGVAKAYLPGGSVSLPRLRKSAEPELNSTARALKYSGIILLTFVVEKDGTPSHIRVLHALGLGLDEGAVAAVSQYRFQPAMENGLPVAVTLNVEVNFQTF